MPPRHRAALLPPQLALLLLPLLAMPVRALDLSQSVEVGASAAEVWDQIADFCAIRNWHPAIVDCQASEQGGAALRTLTTTDGAELVEKRIQYSDEGTSYSYTIITSPLPVTDHVATLAVMDGRNGAIITWSSEFTAQGSDDAEALAAIEALQQAGLEGLQERFGQ